MVNRRSGGSPCTIGQTARTGRSRWDSEPGATIVAAPGIITRTVPLADPVELLLEGRPVGVQCPFREVLPDPHRGRAEGRRGEASRGRHDPLLLSLLRPGVEIRGKLALERAADLLAIRAELAQRLLDLGRQELRRKLLLLLAPNRSLRPTEEPLRATERQERHAGGDARGLRGSLSNPRRDVDGGSAGRLQAVEFFGQVRAGRYDLRESGIRARANSIVSFVMSIVF